MKDSISEVRKTLEPLADMSADQGVKKSAEQFFSKVMVVTRLLVEDRNITEGCNKLIEFEEDFADFTSSLTD